MPRKSSAGKFLMLVGDGMGDYPLPELGGKTPLETARTPHLDRVASGRIGLARTIPDGLEPGSDVANLSLLGYDPLAYPTRRGPFEAASLGVSLGPTEVAFRMNLVTLDRRSEDDIRMVSHSSGDISTAEAREIVATLAQKLTAPGVKVHPGVAYRHLLVWDRGPAEAATIPPHDVPGHNMAPYLNLSAGDPVPALIRRSWDLLAEHPVNLGRRQKGLKEANSIWLWGQGRPPQMPRFKELFDLEGGVISAVDLLRGIGIYAGLRPIHVEGATGYLDTNFFGKADEALKALWDLDFVFVHVEAPDEASHSGNLREKIQAIEAFDAKVVGRVLAGLNRFDDFRVMVASDHLTPIPKRTHTAEPTPFAWADRAELERRAHGPGFTEKAALASGLAFERGHELMAAFLGRAGTP